MKIKFKELHIKNFLSFESADIDFSEYSGFTFISGINNYVSDNSSSNGSGKSSIWEAISWCLTGNTIRGSKEVKRLNSVDDCSVCLTFSIDEDFYRIERIKPSKLFVYKNNEDISGKGIRDTEKVLSQILPDLNSDLIGSVIILGQGLPNRFTNNTPSGRKEILEKLSKSDFMISDIKDKISNRRAELSTALRTSEDEKLKLSSDITNATNTIKDCEFNLNSLSNTDYGKELTGVEQSLKQSETELSDKNKELDDVTSNLDYCKEVLSNIQVEKQSAADGVKNKYKESISNREIEIVGYDGEIKALNREIDRIKSMKDVCPTCGQKLPNVVIPDISEQKKSLAELTEKRNTAEKEFHDLVNKETSELNEIESVYKDKISKCKEEVEQHQKHSNSLSVEVKRLTDDIKTFQSKVFELKSKIDTLQDKVRFYNEQIEKNNKIVEDTTTKILYLNNEIVDLQNRLDVISKMDTIVKRDFRGHLLTNIISYIDKKAKEYCQLLFDNEKIEFRLDGNNILIQYDLKDYECLSGGEKQKIDLIIQFSIRNMLCKYLNFSSNILVLDEITDNLDSIGCQKVFNLIASKLTDIENVYIISHHTDLQLPIDKELVIEKGADGISRII